MRYKCEIRKSPMKRGGRRERWTDLVKSRDQKTKDQKKKEEKMKREEN